MSDLPLHALGLRKTKTGRDDKEPAYAISERRCCSYVGCCALLVVACGALALLLLESASARDALAPHADDAFGGVVDFWGLWKRPPVSFLDERKAKRCASTPVEEPFDARDAVEEAFLD